LSERGGVNVWVLMSTVFVASLCGSLHCVGMCGPFALLASADPDKRRSALSPTLAYSFGRLLSYSFVGLIFGALGMALNRGVRFSSVQQTATYVAGCVMVVVGVVSLARYLGYPIRLPQFFAPVQQMLQFAYRRTLALDRLPRAVAIGALSSLMPCGWLYVFAITAAGTGSPLWGMALMISFWAGTVPIMTALMLGFQRVGNKFEERLPVVMASLVIGLGIFTLGFRAPVVVGAETKVVADIESMTERVHDVDHSKLPCCQGN